MRTDRLAWSQVACDNLKKAGATDEIFYYRRVLGKEKYAAHVFIAQYASQEQLKQHWESLNDNIALLYQSNVDSLLERSNFYLCFFLPESLDIIEKEKIENDAYCAKKYIFVSKKELSIEEKIRKINEKIFELTYLEPQDTSETKLISMQVQNFRIYKGQKNFAFTAENSPDCPASLVMIYAPNGMGKTSICDALEWALTGRIQRLSDMEKLIGRSNMLLHNREKYKSVEEYRRNKEYALVKLVLRNRAGAQDELQRVVRRNANDLNVGTFKGTLEGREKPFQNELHWNQIIMPHDQIEKFVSAIKPSDRYNEWMICVDPNGILQEQYKRRYTEYSEEQIKALEQEEQNIYLNAAEFGWDWKQPLTVKEAENTLLEQNKDWKKKESDVYAQKELLEQHQKNLQLEKQNAECTVDKLKTWRAGIEKDPLWGKSVTYLREQSLDFDWNKRLHSLLLQSAEENSKIGDLQEKMNQITEISHSSIEALNTARTRAQKALQNQQKIFSEIAALVEKPEPRIEDLKQAREICVFEQEQKQTQISKLGNVIYSEGVSESIRKYNEYKTKIESLEHKIVTRKQALQKAQEALEAEKKTLLAELQKYFQQPLFNEIYQKIDPHPYMKKVSYEIMYNDEKNEPELYIKTLADKREPYHPELFFSTAQLNTVALSSFLSRALSLTEIPIGTIVIDDPVGHFDDMNILGFADLMRSIIEKSQKQIVITTHDETVYQIFRRKLPPEIYSSRFIDMTAE